MGPVPFVKESCLSTIGIHNSRFFMIPREHKLARSLGRFLLCCIFFLSLTIIGFPNSYASDQPNIVLILADDLGLGDVGAFGSEEINTPNIDSLSEMGIRFTQAYVSHPVCSPSRAGLITGRYQQRHGWEFNPARRDLHSGMNLGEETLAEALKEQGYSTGLVGKWHLGQGDAYHPLSRGFDHFYGVLGGGTQYFETLPEGAAYALSGQPMKRPDYNAIHSGRNKVTDDGYLTDSFTREAVSFIDQHADEPFFLYLSHIAPHTPLQAPKTYLDRYGHIKEMPKKVYAAMVSALDDSVGEIVSKLEDIGQLENTLIAFISDNGCAGYIDNACSNLNYSGFKRYHQEGGIRVPFILAWPRMLSGGGTYESAVISLDLFSTFTAAAGFESKTEDSVNLLPYLEGENAKAPHDYLYWRSGPTRAIRGSRWKMIQYKRSTLVEADLNATGRLDPPENGWGNETPDGIVTLLYDLSVDPFEQHNLAEEFPNIIRDLKARFEQWNAELPTPDSAILPAIRSTLTEIDGQAVQLIF